jgi:diguanylate cyclase (GGDEF)-like protein
MHKLFILGGSLSAHAKKLREMDSTVRSFKSFDLFKKVTSSADLIIADSAAIPEKKEFIALTKGTPKVIIISDEPGSKATGWLSEPLTYVAYAPSPIELNSIALRVLRESSKLQMNSELLNELSHIRDNIEFLEKLSHVLITSKNPTEIFSVIIKRGAKETGADGWAYFINDEDSGELYCKKSLGMERCCSSVKGEKQCLAAEVSKKKSTMRLTGKPKSKGRNIKPTIHNGSYLGVPVLREDKVFAVLELYKSPGQKGFSKEEAKTIENLADMASNAVEKIGLQLRLEELVITDDLTKLFNSRYLNRSLDNEIQRSSRYGNSVSVIFMDLDHFKDVNDTHGHLIGSKLLAEIGQLLLGQLRNLDIVARYGGDEFVIVLPQTELYSAMMIAERIRKEIEESILLKSSGMNLKVTASFGVSSFPETANSKEALIQVADASMYNVKKNTRNGVYAII